MENWDKGCGGKWSQIESDELIIITKIYSFCVYLCIVEAEGRRKIAML